MLGLSWGTLTTSKLMPDRTSSCKTAKAVWGSSAFRLQNDTWLTSAWKTLISTISAKAHC